MRNLIEERSNSCDERQLTNIWGRGDRGGELTGVTDLNFIYVGRVLDQEGMWTQYRINIIKKEEKRGLRSFGEGKAFWASLGWGKKEFEGGGGKKVFVVEKVSYFSGRPEHFVRGAVLWEESPGERERCSSTPPVT